MRPVNASMARPGVVVASVAALVAFAANSLLTRAALAPGADGGSALGATAFVALRLVSGAVALAPWWWPRRRFEPSTQPVRPDAQATSDRRWASRALSATALVAYAVPFTLAYLAMSAGTGALLLFGSVQVTMIGTGLLRGERLGPARVLGLVAAAAGVTTLVAPGLSAPPAWAAASMIVAGVAWGVYTLSGRGERDPVRATARNFALAAPVGLLAAVAPGTWDDATVRGVILAVASGAITSGAGYLVWYRALPHLSRTVASVLQLTVPLLAAFGGVAWLDESIAPRLIVASVLVLGGVATVLAAPHLTGKSGAP